MPKELEKELKNGNLPIKRSVRKMGDRFLESGNISQIKIVLAKHYGMYPKDITRAIGVLKENPEKFKGLTDLRNHVYDWDKDSDKEDELD